jgi:hypothetical protein
LYAAPGSLHCVGFAALSRRVVAAKTKQRSWPQAAGPKTSGIMDCHRQSATVSRRIANGALAAFTSTSSENLTNAASTMATKPTAS